MDVLAELVARITADTTELKKALADSEKDVKGTGAVIEKETKSIAERFKEMGKAATVMGAAITASMGLMVKAAIDEEINIKHLQVALKGVGVSYDGVKDSLEGVISATQRKTGIADDEQRDVLSQLILVTGDYNKALKLLPLTLDLASFATMSARSAATYLAKAYEELENGAERISIRMGTTSVYFKDLDAVQRKVGGSAEAMSNPFKVLQATMGDLSEEIGATLIPAVKGIIDPLVDVSAKVQEFIRDQPELTKALAGAALAMGVLATAIGGVSLAITFLGASLVPVMAAIVVIGGLTAAGIALYDTFHKVEKQMQATVTPIDDLTSSLGIMTQETQRLATESEKASTKAIQALDKLGTQTVEALKRRNKEAEQAESDSLDTRLRATKDFWDDIERESDDARRSIIQDIEYQRDVELASISDSLKARERWYNETVAYYEKAADARLKTLRTETNSQIKAIQSQIDIIEEQRDEQRKGEQEARDAARKSALISQWMVANAKKDTSTTARLAGELAELESDIRKRQFEEARQAEIKSLQDKISLIREDTRTKEEQIKDDLKDQKDKLQAEFDTFKGHNVQMMGEQKDYWKNRIEGSQAVFEEAKIIEKAQRTLEETRLTDEKVAIKSHYETLNKEETLQGETRRLILSENQEELIQLLKDYNPKWQDAGQSLGESLIRGLQSTKQSMQSTIKEMVGLLGGARTLQEAAQSAQWGQEIVEKELAEAQAVAPRETSGQVTEKYLGGGYPSYEKYMEAYQESLPKFGEGAIVTQPTMAIVGDKGPEIITPLGKAGISVIFEGPVYGWADFESKVAEAVKSHVVRGGFHGVLQGA